LNLVCGLHGFLLQEIKWDELLELHFTIFIAKRNQLITYL
jgi:hypothetical protein